MYRSVRPRIVIKVMYHCDTRPSVAMAAEQKRPENAVGEDDVGLQFRCQVVGCHIRECNRGPMKRGVKTSLRKRQLPNVGPTHKRRTGRTEYANSRIRQFLQVRLITYIRAYDVDVVVRRERRESIDGMSEPALGESESAL